MAFLLPQCSTPFSASSGHLQEKALCLSPSLQKVHRGGACCKFQGRSGELRGVRTRARQAPRKALRVKQLRTLRELEGLAAAPAGEEPAVFFSEPPLGLDSLRNHGAEEDGAPGAGAPSWRREPMARSGPGLAQPEPPEQAQYWEGDMGPMTDAEEQALLKEADAEIALLEKQWREGDGRGGRMVEVDCDQVLARDNAGPSTPSNEGSSSARWLGAAAAEQSFKGRLELLPEQAEESQQQLEAEKGAPPLQGSTRRRRSMPLPGKSPAEPWPGLEDRALPGLGKTLVGAVHEPASETRARGDPWVEEMPWEAAESSQAWAEEEETLPLSHALRAERRLQRLEMQGLSAADEEEELENKAVKDRGLPAIMRCFDTAKIYVKAGNGGDGVVAFRREKFVPDGGPSGGNGGRGGNVYLVADRSLSSLLRFRRAVHFRAGRGAHGQGKCRHGEAGRDLEIRVPPGTVVRQAPGASPTLRPLPASAVRSPAGWGGELAGMEGLAAVSGDMSSSGAEDGGGRVLLELLKPGQKELLLAGGRGGLGNAAFKSGRTRAPQLAEHGEAGPEMWVQLELKLVADVGIVGAPNAGKSTFLSVISAAKPKVANYPFTTLVPNLGVVQLGSNGHAGSDFGRTLVFADVPGLLEGAHTGAGLGHEFLRHTDRCSVLVHVVDGSGPQPLHELQAIAAELELFSPALACKPRLIVFNKMDLPEAQARWPSFRAAAEQELARAPGAGASGHSGAVLCMSGATHHGVWDVVAAAATLVDALPQNKDAGQHDGWSEEDNWEESMKARKRTSVAAMIQQARRNALSDFEVDSDKHTRTFFVRGEGLYRFLQMTNWEYFESGRRFGHVLESSGVNEALRQRGIKEGDTVVIGEMEFDWRESQDWSTMMGRGWKRGVRGSRLWPH